MSDSATLDVPFTEKEWDALTDQEKTDVIQKMADFACERDGVWAGVPFFSEYAKVTMHPRYPYQGLCDIGGDTDIHNEYSNYKMLVAIVKATDRMRIDRQAEDFEDNVIFVGSFFSQRINSTVLILEYSKTGKRFCATVPHDNNDRLEKLVSYIGVSFSWDANAEIKAQELLRSHISEHQWKQFVLTGSFLESSKRSNVIYMFRRGRPTLAQSGEYVDGVGSGRAVFLAALCSHGIGYYQNTFAGAMTPTDDLIAHLLLMRSDEWAFWKQSEQHSLHEIESGL